MASFNEIRQEINDNIYENQDGDITGEVLNEVLNDMVDAMEDGNLLRAFKGWWPDLATLKAAVTAEPGDYAYIEDASPATTTSIYVYDANAESDNYWADSGRTVDTSNVQTFETLQQVNEVSIIDDLETGGVNDVLSAEQGKVLNEKVSQLDQKLNDAAIIKSFAMPTSVSDGFYNESLEGNTTGTFTKRLYDISSSVKSRYIGIVINAAPRSGAWCSVVDISNNVLWHSNSVTDFPKTLLFSEYPAIAQVYISSEKSVNPNPICSLSYSIHNEIDNYTERNTLTWLSNKGIDSNGDVGSFSNRECLVYDLTNVVRVDITADCPINSYIYLDDDKGNHLLTITGRMLSNAVIFVSDYQGAKTLKVTSINDSPHSVIAYELKKIKPVVVNNVSFKRGTFDSNHVIQMPSLNGVSRFSTYPLPLKISYYDGVVGCNLSARDYCKNGASTQTIFVSPDGNDSNSGLYPIEPLATLEAALAVNGVSTIVLLPGIYCVGVNFTAGLEIEDEVNIIGSGDVVIENYGNPIVIKASVYVENITFRHGNSCLKTDLTTEVCSFYKCKFMESDAENGLTALGGVYILEECEASYNLRDGFNYHKSTTGNVYPKVLEINCEGYYNGARDTNNINNGSTGHDAAVLIRLLCSYGYSRGCAVAEVANCWSLNIGVSAFCSIEHGADNTKKSNFGLQAVGSASAGTRMWLIGCKSFGSMYDVYAENGSYMFRTSAFPKEYGNGTYATYQVEYANP